MENPLEDRFIVPRMRESEMRRRVVQLVEGDWREQAERLAEQRRTGEVKGEMFVM
jgi:hypothetical protein